MEPERPHCLDTFSGAIVRANVSLVWILTQLMEHGLISLDEDQLQRVIASDGTAKNQWLSKQDCGLLDKPLHL